MKVDYYYSLGCRESRVRDCREWAAEHADTVCYGHRVHPASVALAAHLESLDHEEDVSIDSCTYQDVQVASRSIAEILRGCAGPSLVTGPCIVGGKPVEGIVTLNGAHRIVIRGDAEPSLNTCNRCGAALYYHGVSRQMLLARDVGLGFSVALEPWSTMLIVNREVLDALKGHLSNVVVTRLEVFDGPQDGFPPELSDLPPYFKDRALVEKLKRERQPGLPALPPPYMRHRLRKKKA